MKLVEDSKPVFRPIPITLETEADLIFFRDVFGALSGRTEAAYGLNSHETVEIFGALNAEAHRLGLKDSNVTVKINVKGPQ